MSDFTKDELERLGRLLIVAVATEGLDKPIEVTTRDYGRTIVINGKNGRWEVSLSTPLMGRQPLRREGVDADKPIKLSRLEAYLDGDYDSPWHE